MLSYRRISKSPLMMGTPPSKGKLAAKEAYFKEQALLDLSDDERDFQNGGESVVSRALDDSISMAPPKLAREGSSFLGPTPKERQAEFEAHATKQRITSRAKDHSPDRPSTAPEVELKRSKSGPIAEVQRASTLKRVSSLPNVATANSIPFYKRMGKIPRELRNGKSVRPADNIALEPESKQLLKHRIVYFYPNDDISMQRRTRIHKVIQLGAAWVDRWREDVTHIILDNVSYSYSQLLRHLNRAGFSRHVVLVNFDPYIPQCIQFGLLLDPAAQRFTIKGAPKQTHTVAASASSQSTDQSQVSLKVKLSKREIAAQGSVKTDSHPTNPSIDSAPSTADPPPSSAEEVVKDSFIMPSSEAGTTADEAPNADRFDDALSKAIEEAKSTAHLPLDEDEDTDSSTTAAVFDDDGGEELSEPTTANTKRKFTFVSKASALRDKSLNMNTFQCMDPGSAGYSSKNPNAPTIKILEEMGRHYDQMQDHWRTTAYRKAVTTLKKQRAKITTAEEAASLPFIGSRLADKIEEIVLTNRLRKLDNTKIDPLDAVLRLFLGIYGVGLVQANKWIQAGYRTLDDLLAKAKLTDSHKVGIEHYSDFNSRIPRAEVGAHGVVVKAALKRINERFDATVMGSYRRGAKDSGDIDMIITCPDASPAILHNVVFEQLIPQLYKDDFLKASLVTNRSNDPSGSKWHGASCLPGSKVWRRLDFLLVPDCEMGAALIYFTGNDIFNRSIRLLARKKGMRLNQRGLYKDVQRGKTGVTLNEGTLLEGGSEKKIFEILGVPWRQPWERIC